MKAETRRFGTIEIEDEKIIRMEKGMIGLPDFKNFALIFDEEKGFENTKIMWLQSMDDGETAFPVMNPCIVKEDYNPTINEELLSPLGDLNSENLFILVTVTVPRKVEDFTVNLKAPIIINSDNMKAAQIIIEDDMPIKFKGYDILKNKKEKAGG